LASNEFSILNDDTVSTFGKLTAPNSTVDDNINYYYDDVMDYDPIEFFYGRKH